MATAAPFGRRVATGIAQPDGFLDQRAGAVVLAEHVTDFVVGVEDRATRAAGLVHRVQVCVRPAFQSRTSDGGVVVFEVAKLYSRSLKVVVKGGSD